MSTLERTREDLERELAACDAQLGEARETLRAILSQGADSVVVCDRQGRITFASAAACRLAGLDPTGRTLDAALRSWGQAYYADGRPVPAGESSLLPIFGGESRPDQEIRVVGKDGRHFDLRASVRPLCDGDGRVIGAVTTLSDITSHKRREEALAEQEQRLHETRAELQASQEETASQNEELQSMLEELEKHRQHLEELVQERTVELRQSVDLVAAERKRFQDVLDQLPAYLILLSPDYRVPFANRFFEERFGKSGGRQCYDYLFQRSEPCENCETFKVLKTGAPHHWYWAGPDGRDYDIYDFPFTDIDGSPLIMEVGLDITDRKAVEAELAKHRQHLEDLVAQRAGQLQAANEKLQAEVAERKRAEERLRATNDELTRFNRAMVDREIRMIELKKQVNELCARLGQPPRYTLDFGK
jgi:PAS domain-containing protein